jgi:hypothetical protein
VLVDPGPAHGSSHVSAIRAILFITCRAGL